MPRNDTTEKLVGHEADRDGLDHENLGRRIAEHRAKLGFTQQELADRLAVSRVTVSHLEAGMTTPGERTVALLAGLFKVEPHELVAGTSYPVAKKDRLPLVAARYTEVEHQLLLLEGDLAWLDRLDRSGADALIARWQVTVDYLLDVSHDRRERDELLLASRRLRDLRHRGA